VDGREEGWRRAEQFMQREGLSPWDWDELDNLKSLNQKLLMNPTSTPTVFPELH
jgi:hypothetical protein